ncbi:MAG: hypothetical protein COB46_01945 [Rhodospirillaceae bacterium]|nr:MAG: hypothetical protein COB46_01945 [Rhodospirillaceae bacterium]
MIFKQLLQESKISFRKIIGLGIISAVASCVMLAILNNATSEVKVGEANYQGFLLFMIALVLSVLTKKVSLDRTQNIVQGVLRGIRIRIADKIRKSSLVSFETRGKEIYYVALTQQTSFISNSSMTLINASQSLVIIFACIFYIGWISPVSLLLILVFVAAGILLYQLKEGEFQSKIIKATQKESRFFALLNHILDGFKELNLSNRKSDAVFREFNTISDQATALKVATGAKLTETIMFSQAYMYILIAALIVVFPFFELTPYSEIPKLIVAVLFFWSSLESVVAAIPDFAKASTAMAQLSQLEQELEHVEDLIAPKSQTTQDPFTFRAELALNQLVYRHQGKDDEVVFQVGPVDAKVKKGEILFICGGNGSGKTSLIKALSSLYPPSSGELTLDGHEISKEERFHYRQLFSVVYSDFHLFDKLYGLRDIDHKRVNGLLDQLGLSSKTAFTGNAFTNLNLSHGQRKRLAIVVSLLEERPIYLFDEPAAELDPEFRKYFYETFLPELRDEGKTIVVITHDDRYFSCCDRILKMDSGLIVEEKQL